MKLPRRPFLHLAAGAAVLPVAAHVARAQAYPARAVRVIVPFAPGGMTDVFARLAAQKLTEHFGRQLQRGPKPVKVLRSLEKIRSLNTRKNSESSEESSQLLKTDEGMQVWEGVA